MSNNLGNDSADHHNRVKGTEVFVGGLSQSVTEAKIREVFSTCGDITEIRMIKDQKGSSKGYCFLKFLTRDAAVKAIKYKAGTLLEGRKIGVLPSMEQNSLFLGNLPKEWSPDEFDRMVKQVFQDVVSVNLVMLSSDGGPQSSEKQQNRGFGFVQFVSHAAAARAYRMGSRSDFVIGAKCHPTVQWAEEEPENDPEELAKVKVAFIRNLPVDVSEGFLKELFGHYGQIEKVVLSKKGQSQVGFVHFAKRLDLDHAVKETNDKTVQGPSGGSFKLQVEVARPFEKSKKRAREGSSSTTNKPVSQSKALKTEAAFPSIGCPVVKELEDPVVADPYEAIVISLPVTVKDRLLRILRLGIATRYDIDIHCLRSLREIPESAAISVLDQFLLSGADEIDKGSFLLGLVTKYHARSLGASQMPEYTTIATDIASARSDLVRLSSRSQVPVVDSLSYPIATTISRYDSYLAHLPYSKYSLSPQVGITRALEERNPSPLPFSGSSPSYGRMSVNSPIALGASPVPLGASHQSRRPPVRFDPFTGEPYKFDPFTGEPIEPESLSRGSGSLY